MVRARNSKTVSTVFNKKELAIIDTYIDYLINIKVLKKKTYYQFLRLAVFRLIEEINKTHLAIQAKKKAQTIQLGVGQPI